MSHFPKLCRFQVTKSFIELGIIRENFPLKFYENLEEAFIASTLNYYYEKSRKFMIELNMTRSMSFDDYMNAVHLIFANETARVETYLLERSVPDVVKVCEECLIKNHSGIFERAFEEYLMRGDFEKIGQFYDLVNRFPENLEIFSNIFKSHVQKEGDSLLSRLENVLDVNPQIYVETILDVYEKYEKLIKVEMLGSEIFTKALEESSKSFINENAVTLASAFEDRNAELLAKYCDVLLSKNSSFNYSEEVIKKKMSLVWMVFKVLNDKDGFQKFYENITARRLIFNLTANEEIEKCMIDKLQDYFGKQDSKSLKDIVINKQNSLEINTEFRKFAEKDEKILKNFTVTILAEQSCEFAIKVSKIFCYLFIFYRAFYKCITLRHIKAVHSIPSSRFRVFS